MRHLLLACGLAFCALIARAEVIDIDNAQLRQLMQSGVPLIDIRTQPEWEESGIIGGSRLLTFFDAQGRHDAAAWLRKAEAIAKPSQPLIVICRSGNRTRAVSQFLSQQAGYRTVYNVKAGVKGWLADGGALQPAGRSIAACRAAQAC